MRSSANSPKINPFADRRGHDHSGKENQASVMYPNWQVANQETRVCWGGGSDRCVVGIKTAAVAGRTHDVLKTAANASRTCDVLEY